MDDETPATPCDPPSPEESALPESRQVRRGARTHDYSAQGWGHAIHLHRIRDGGQTLCVTGFGLGVREGDFVVLPNKQSTTCYQVREVQYAADPPDHWYATLTFAPRQGGGEGA